MRQLYYFVSGSPRQCITDTMLSLQLLRSTVASFFLANIAAVMLSNAASYTTLNSSQIQGILDTTATTASNLQLTHLSITQHGTRSDADYFGHSPLPTSGNVSEFLLNSTFVQGSHQSLAVSQAITATTKRPIDSYTLWLSQCAVAILTYGSPFLIALATVGNTLSVIVLRHPTFRKSSTSFILSALAVGDAVLVDIGLMRQWISYAFNIDIRLFSSFGCKLHVFLVYFLTMVSIYGKHLDNFYYHLDNFSANSHGYYLNIIRATVRFDFIPLTRSACKLSWYVLCK